MSEHHYIGLDIGLKAEHKAVICDVNGKRNHECTLSNSPQEFEMLLTKAGWPETPITIVMEPTGNIHKRIALFFYRKQNVTVYVVKTVECHDLRKFYRRHTKTDRIDAYTLSRIPVIKPEHLYPFRGIDSPRLALNRMSKERSKLMDELNRHTRRIQKLMELANPGVLDQLSEVLSKSGKKLLMYGVNPFHLKRIGAGRVYKMLKKASRGMLHKEKIDAIMRIVNVNCRFVRESDLPYEQLEREARNELESVTFLERKIEELNKSIKEMYCSIDSEQTLQQIAGIGSIAAAAFEAEMGNIEKYRSLRAFRMFYGNAPRKNQSGELDSKGQSMTKAGNKHIRHLLYMCAEAARKEDPQMAALYYRLMVNGRKHHYKAIGAVMSDLLNRIYAVLKRRDKNGKAVYEWRDENGRASSKEEAVKIAKRFKVPESIRKQLRKKTKGNRWTKNRSRSKNATLRNQTIPNITVRK